MNVVEISVDSVSYPTTRPLESYDTIEAKVRVDQDTYEWFHHNTGATKICDCITEDDFAIVRPPQFKPKTNSYSLWYNACELARVHYYTLKCDHNTSRESAIVLPRSLACYIRIQLRADEWSEFFKPRKMGGELPPQVVYTVKQLERAIPPLQEII